MALAPCLAVLPTAALPIVHKTNLGIEIERSQGVCSSEGGGERGAPVCVGTCGGSPAAPATRCPRTQPTTARRPPAAFHCTEPCVWLAWRSWSEQHWASVAAALREALRHSANHGIDWRRTYNKNAAATLRAWRPETKGMAAVTAVAAAADTLQEDSAPLRLQLACGMAHTLVCTDSGDTWAFGAGRCAQQRMHTRCGRIFGGKMCLCY